MLKLFIIGCGGFVGSILRYIISGVVSDFTTSYSLPYGTLSVNILGCLLIGFCGGLMEGRQIFTPEARIFVFIGLLGGFTTFSTFEYETFNLLRDGQILDTIINILLHIILGFFAIWAGTMLSKIVLAKLT